jgi:type IV secretion system protein VirB10
MSDNGRGECYAANMFRIAIATLSLVYLACLDVSAATDPDRDFSGKWTLESGGSSNAQAVSFNEDRAFTVTQQDTAILCSTSGTGAAPVKWTYPLDRNETRYQIGAETRSSATKWEGDALLINTLVTGPQNYTVMDRWKLSRDHATLTVERQLQRGASQTEGVLVYHREGASTPKTFITEAPTPGAAPVAVLRRPAEPAAPSEITVPAGTRIPLALRNGIDSKHSHEGDRVYLETVYPVTIDGRIVVPRGSFVNGTLTISKPAGVVKGKGELFIRFDSLSLPNGVTRDFRSRMGSADSVEGKVDRKEGTVTGERDKAGTAKTTAEGAGIGASVGSIAGAAAGSPLAGAGIGAAAGAAAGLASVLVKHRPDASIRAGATVEMILDRDIRYLPKELNF